MSAKSSKCDWSKSAKKCVQEPDDEEMVPNSGSAAAGQDDKEVCASLYKKRAKCQKTGCIWKKAKSAKSRCTSEPTD